MVILHIGIHVSDVIASKRFLVAALKPLGIVITMEEKGWFMIGREGEGNIWIGAFGDVTSPIHIAFAAETREQVGQFYAAALAAGGADDGAPGIRANYHPDYYGAFLFAPDGHNIEAVCDKPE